MTQVRKRKSAADRKAEIVDTVIKLSHHMGPDRVTTQHLADVVGVSQPAIFRHFATKSEIWNAVGQRLYSEISTLPSAAQTSFDAIKTHMMAFFDLVRRHPSIPAILASHELQSDNADLRAQFTGLHRERHKLLSGLVSGGQASGELRSDILADDAAEIILSAVHQMSHAWSLSDHGFDLVDEGKRLCASFATLLMRG